MTIGTQIGLVLQVTTVLIFLAMSRKIWWSPIAGLVNQGIWIAYALSGPAETKVMLPSICMFIIVYACAIPKWIRERNKKPVSKTIYCEWCGTELNERGQMVPTKDEIEAEFEKKVKQNDRFSRLRKGLINRV